MLQLNRIYCGDNLHLLKQLDDNSINLHICSPPYADMRVYENFSGIHPDKYVDWIMPRIKEIERTLKNDGSFILNINDKIVNKVRHPYVFNLITEIHRQTGLKMYERLFWDKGKYLPHKSRFGDRVEYLFWFIKNDDFYINIDAMRNPYSELSLKRMEKPIKKRFARNEQNQDATEYKEWKPNPLGALPSTLVKIGSESQRQSQKHTAIFPIGLPSYFIKGATKKDDIVCDIFSGSGSTAVAAKLLNRNYIGFEISEFYVNESIKRLDNVKITKPL